MNNKKQIVVRAFDDGRIEVEAVGFKGKQCQEATKEIESLLGNVTDIKHKAEWWTENGHRVRQSRKSHNLNVDKLCG